MDLLTLTVVLLPAPLLLSWFTWLHPTRAHIRIAHDINHFINLYFANRHLNVRPTFVPHDEPVQSQRFAQEAGVESPHRHGRRIRGSEHRTTHVRGWQHDSSASASALVPGAGAAAHSTRTTTSTASTEQTLKTTMSHSNPGLNPDPQEQAKQYQNRQSALQEKQEAEARRKQEKQRQQRQREKWLKIQRENQLGHVVAVTSGVHDVHRKKEGGDRAGEHDDNDAATRAWVRSRRVAGAMERERGCEHEKECRRGQHGGNGGGRPNGVWGSALLARRAEGSAAAGTGAGAGAAVLDMETVWGKMPALGTR